MADHRIKALLISIGGSPEPVIYSVNELRPECLCFFASEETRPFINNEILPRLTDRPVWMAEIITEDANDLLSCYKAITGKWKELHKNWRLEPGDWVVDYTGGTKPMVASLVLATIDDTSGYRYISGSERTKGGTGIVIDGREQVLHQINPWDHLAIKERQDAAVLFGRGRYKQVSEIFDGVAKRVSGGEKHLYKALSDVAGGYAHWDNFQHRLAWEKLRPSQKSLEMATVFGGPPGLKSFAAMLKENLTFLEKLSVGMTGIRSEHFLDLLSNAKRRADLEHKYDDAVARLYRAVEAYAQVRLSARGINTSDVQEGQLPPDISADFAGKFRSDIDNRIRLPLYGAYKLLKSLGDPAGTAFFDNWPQMKLLLDSRNNSILAHGLEPVKRERYEEMFRLICKIGGVNESSLPGFPDLHL
ncbi:MAG: TIGR02710 family CRISPR-associated protein [Nitrospirae bacterium]|nr:TIGR02710 family CRISPR-associated protein [Nitrospirota bacterium]